MGIDLSKFTKDIQAKIQAALSNDNKIDADELREMNLAENVKSELMKQLAGNPGMIGDGFVGKESSDSTFLFYDKPKNGIVDFTNKTKAYFQNKYPDKDIAEGFMQDGVMYLRNSKGELVKDDNNVYISEKIFTEEKKEIEFLNKDGSINIEKFQEYLNTLPETDEDYQTLMKDIEDANKEKSYWSIDKFADTQKERFMEVYQAISNGEFSLAGELMYSYFQAECQGFDENVLSKIRSGLERITGAKWAGPALYSTLSWMAENADDITGRDENGIGIAERLIVGLGNVDKGLGDFIFSTEGLFTMGAIAGGEALLAKASSTLAPYIGAVIHSYFGAEGTVMVTDGAVKVARGKSLEEVAEGGQEIGHGLPLMGTVVRAGGEMYKGIKVKTDYNNTKRQRFRQNCEKLGMSETEVADLVAYQQTAIDYVKKVQNDNAKRAFSIKIKNSYSSELFPDIRESQQIKRNSKKMIQNLEENPQLVELYRELERISKAENERTGYDQDINHLHSHIQYILEDIDPKNAGTAIELARFIESQGTEHVTYLIGQNLQHANISETDVELKKSFYKGIKNDTDITEETRLELLKYLDENSCKYIAAIYPYLKPEHKNKTSCSNAGDILYCRTKADADVKLEIFKKYGVDSFSILKDITAENGKTAKLILEDNTLSDTVRWAMFGNEEAMKKYQELKDDPDILDSDINTLLFGGKTSGCIELIENTESIEVYKYFSKKEGFPKELVAGIAVECNEYTKELALMMSEIQDFPPEHIAPILREVKAKGDMIFDSMSKEELTKLSQSASALLSSGISPEIIAPTIKVITKENLDYSLDICTNWQKQEILPKQVPLMIYYKDHISAQQFRKLNKKLGADAVSKLEFDDIYLGAKFADIIDVKNISEIPLAGKKEFIRNLVDCNTGMFEISDDLKPHLPLLPTDNEQYCGLMRAAVKSLGIETNPLTPEGVNKFGLAVKDLSKSLADLSDKEFADLNITQEFSREDFIAVVREKAKGLSQLEKQKVYDYFGFELHHKLAKEQRKEYTITGYPVNLNNGQKLAEITDPNTKAVVESLREDVVRFSEKNPIKCNNKQIETFLNEVVEAMPEIRSMIGRKQHGTHDFDVMQHSLKVMQKIVQDPKFEQLNESDKKLMLLASLLHDITKAEGISDKTHASEGSFDAYYITKKFKLSRDEELKLSDLIRHHEWLGNVNRDIRINTERMKPEEAEKKKQEILTKRLQSAAFDMQNDNLFDMVMIFTHADLKAVKADDTFHDTRIGDKRAVFDKNNNRVFDPIKQAKGVRKSHGEAADIYAERIREYIHELQKTRPLTPTTKVPTMSEIKLRLNVNPDGSTQFKGVWVDKDGLVVIKVNDVEDWEGIGFPKGTTTKGIFANVKNHGEESHEVETGNFKLMVHGLEFSNQLAKFNAFGLPSSETMLSLTYMERPETKSRNFRPQGVGLDFDSKYIYGGGETDAGSGCGKTISDFKADYIFGGHREGDRKFVADIVKKATGMTDEEYIQFYEANKDKAWEEFDNQDIANALIVAYAEGIHSNVRYGKRAYTEFYGSNPKRVNSTWVFSLDPNEKIENPLEFLHRTDLTEGELNSADIGGRAARSVADRTQFLREFSLNKDNDVPMFIFGD